MFRQKIREGPFFFNSVQISRGTESSRAVVLYLSLPGLFILLVLYSRRGELKEKGGRGERGKTGESGGLEEA